MKPIFQPHECLSEETIQSYLKDQLVGDERHKVENHLLDCPLCADATEGFALWALDAQKKPSFRLRPIGFRLLAAAAAALVLLAAGIWLAIKPSGPEQLFTAYYQVYDSDLDIHFRQSDPSIAPADTPLTMGLQAYAEKDYAAAAAQLASFLEQNPDHQIGRFYLGHAQIGAGRWDDAAKNLQQVWAAGMDYSEEANWYTALLLLKSGQMEKAQQALDSLLTSGKGRYFEQAKKLRSSL